MDIAVRPAGRATALGYLELFSVPSPNLPPVVVLAHDSQSPLQNVLFPQQFTIPSSSMPQVCPAPRSIAIRDLFSGSIEIGVGSFLLL